MVNKTTDLIDFLVADLRPVSPLQAALPLLTGLGGGTLAAVAVMAVGLGVRPDLAAALGTASYWIKFLYTLAFGAAALAATVRLGRPGGRAPVAWTMLAAALAIVALLAAGQLAEAPTDERRALLLGGSAALCPWLVVLLSLPIYAGAVFGLRRLAPTRPTLAGLAAGLAAGGMGAWIYAFHCDETGIPFLAIWYTLGILAVGALGAATGRSLLRW